MSRGRWRIVAAIVGLILTAIVVWQLNEFYQAAQQQRDEHQYQPASEPGFRISRVTKAPTDHYKPSCNNPNSRQDADLCAQWAAVEQVTESNRLASLNLRLVVLGFVATIIATGALLWTLWETRMVARRELRAYLYPDGVVIGEGTFLPQRDPKLLGILGSVVGIRNSGTTPAHQVLHWSAVDIAMREKESEMRAPARLDAAFSSNVPPNGAITADRAMAGKPSQKMIAAVKAGRAAAYVYGAVEYRDVFDVRHRTNYRLYFTGAWPPPLGAVMRFCNEGNDAT